MSENVEQNTMCSTCRHKPYCTNAKNAGGPILFCEEFELEDSGAPESRDKVGRLYYYEKQEPNGLMGLCSDCNKWRSCTFPKPEGGIWRCEEYE